MITSAFFTKQLWEANKADWIDKNDCFLFTAEEIKESILQSVGNEVECIYEIAKLRAEVIFVHPQKEEVFFTDRNYWAINNLYHRAKFLQLILETPASKFIVGNSDFWNELSGFCKFLNKNSTLNFNLASVNLVMNLYVAITGDISFTDEKLIQECTARQN